MVRTASDSGPRRFAGGRLDIGPTGNTAPVTTFSGPYLVNTYKRRYRAIAALASVSIGLVAASACSYAPRIDTTPTAAAAAESSAPPTSTPTTEPNGPSVLPTLDEMLAQDRFVPLAVALERSGLDQAIVNLENFVLIAPTDAAFKSSETDIGIQYPTLMNNLGLLEAVRRYHIVARPSTNDSWRTLNGSLLDVDGPTVANIRNVDGIDVLDSIPVRNGTILVVSRLLLPASKPLLNAELPPN